VLIPRSTAPQDAGSTTTGRPDDEEREKFRARSRSAKSGGPQAARRRGGGGGAAEAVWRLQDPALAAGCQWPVAASGQAEAEARSLVSRRGREPRGRRGAVGRGAGLLVAAAALEDLRLAAGH
jgi:hypothetical protein